MRRVGVSAVVGTALLGLTSCVADPPPRSVTAEPGDGQATVSWNAPYGRPDRIVAYELQPWIGNSPRPIVRFNSTTTTQTVTGLTNGTTYRFYVRAISTLGNDSAWSETSNSVTPHPPGGVTFAPVTHQTMGTSPRGIVSGDLDADTHPDLVTVGSAADVVLVQLGNGDGTFAPPVAYPTGPAPKSVAIGDLNRDTHADLLVTNSGRSAEFDDGSVSVLLGNGDGTFAAQTQTGGEVGMSSVAIADLDGDLNPDAVITHPPNGQDFGMWLLVALGDGTGNFHPPDFYWFASHAPVQVAIGDLTGDSIPDIVTASAPDSVHLLSGNGDGTFNVGNDVYTGADGTDALALGDLDGDGSLDVVTANYSSNDVSVLLGDGAGGFGDPMIYPTGAGPLALGVADLNGDGLLDVATVGNTGGGIASVLIGNGDGTHDPATAHPIGNNANSITISDLNGDGLLDLAMANGGTTSILLNTTG